MLVNRDGRFTPDRNWHDNPSFELGTAGWSTAMTTPVSPIVTATSITQVTDNAGQGGTKAGEVVCSGAQWSGVHYPIPYKFRAGVTYAVAIWLKSLSGSLSVDAGIWSNAGGDYNQGAGTITTSWARYTFSWTPSADRSDVILWVRCTATAAATFRIDAVQVNPGSSANAYIEAPTKGMLVPARPVLIFATHASTDYPAFFGYIQRITPNPNDWTVTVTCYDTLKRLDETEAAFSISPLTSWSARDYRIGLLSEYERGLNVAGDNNPSFEDGVGGWELTGGGGSPTLTQVTDAAPGVGGTKAGEWYAPNVNNRLRLFCRRGQRFEKGTIYTATVWLRATSGTPAVTLVLGQDVGVTHYASAVVVLSTTWQRFTVRYRIKETSSAADAGTYTCLQFEVWAQVAGGITVRVDGLMVTRGMAAPPYALPGTGRVPSMCASGSLTGAGSTAGIRATATSSRTRTSWARPAGSRPPTRSIRPSPGPSRRLARAGTSRARGRSSGWRASGHHRDLPGGGDVPDQRVVGASDVHRDGHHRGRLERDSGRQGGGFGAAGRSDGHVQRQVDALGRPDRRSRLLQGDHADERRHHHLRLRHPLRR